MAYRIQYQNTSDIGVYALLTNKYCLTGSGLLQT